MYGATCNVYCRTGREYRDRTIAAGYGGIAACREYRDDRDAAHHSDCAHGRVHPTTQPARRRRRWWSRRNNCQHYAIRADSASASSHSCTTGAGCDSGADRTNAGATGSIYRCAIQHDPSGSGVIWRNIGQGEQRSGRERCIITRQHGRRSGRLAIQQRGIRGGGGHVQRLTGRLIWHCGQRRERENIPTWQRARGNDTHPARRNEQRLLVARGENA